MSISMNVLVNNRPGLDFHAVHICPALRGHIQIKFFSDKEMRNPMADVAWTGRVKRHPIFVDEVRFICLHSAVPGLNCSQLA